MHNMNGSLMIVTGESGAGKSSLVARAVEEKEGMRVITCTTRAPRMNAGKKEQDGIDYHFFSEPLFEEKIAQGEFAEFAQVYPPESGEKRYYGTLLRSIMETRMLSPVAFVVVDIQGAQTLARVYPEAWSIFVHVPKEAVTTRLLLRGETGVEITKRLEKHAEEFAHAKYCNEVLVNSDGKFQETWARFKSMIQMYRSIDLCRLAKK